MHIYKRRKKVLSATLEGQRLSGTNDNLPAVFSILVIYQTVTVSRKFKIERGDISPDPGRDVLHDFMKEREFRCGLVRLRNTLRTEAQVRYTRQPAAKSGSNGPLLYAIPHLNSGFLIKKCYDTMYTQNISIRRPHEYGSGTDSLWLCVGLRGGLVVVHAGY